MSKTSGADGIHVLVPIARRATFEQTYAFAERVSRGLEERHPGSGHDRMAEAQARGRSCRPPSERAGKDDRLGLLRAAEAGRAGLDAASLGRADSGRDTALLRDARGARQVEQHGDLFEPVLAGGQALGRALKKLR